jgi:SM-20-related protein
MSSIRFARTLDPGPYAKQYGDAKLVQITDFLAPDVANSLARSFETLPWQLICQNETGQNILYSKEEWANLSQPQRVAIAKGMHERAARNLGYTYMTFPMIDAYLQRRVPDHPIHALTEFLNSPELLTFAGQVIGHPHLTKASAHASRYGPGHYLTRHTDEGELRERRAAYTLGFSRKWEPDWGGLLLFLDDDLNIPRGFLPRFNTLTIFDGLQPHAVTSVAAFAPHPRLTVTGWFRDDPPAA